MKFAASLVIYWLLKIGAREIQLSGNNFISYDLTSSFSWLLLRSNHSIKLGFKTLEPNALLFYVGYERRKADFVLIDLVHGKLRLTVDLGDNIITTTGHLVLGNNSWVDNRWHTVRIGLMGRNLTVRLHGQKIQTVLQSKFNRLDANGFVYAGGVPQHTRSILQGYKPSSNLKGCLRDLSFDGIKVLVDSTKQNINYKEFGSPGNICRQASVSTLSFESPKAYLYIPSVGKDLFNVHMTFRTYFANAVLAFKGILNARYVSVLLRKGHLNLKVQVSSVTLQLNQGKNLNDGEWHDVFIVVTKTEMRIQLDQMSELKQENRFEKTVEHFSENLYIGYHPHSTSPSFIGCVNNLRVDNRVVQLNKIQRSFMFGNFNKHCKISSHCFPSPCLHGGKCNEVRPGGFSCNCQGTFHLGPVCEKPIYLRTCLEYRNIGVLENAYCKVDPDSEGPATPLQVFCNMTNQDQVITVINHNKVGSQLVSSADYVVFNAYLHTMNYQGDLEGIKALIAQSQRCRQFVSFRCFEAKLTQSPVDEVQIGWLGRSTELITDHWPGAPAGTGKCACGMNRTCADPKLSCNCDIGDKKWREDKGYVTDKANLPVKLLQFNKAASLSYFVVGPLECFGEAENENKVTQGMQRIVTRFINSLCYVVIPTTQAEPHSGASTQKYTKQTGDGTTRESNSLPIMKSSTGHRTDVQPTRESTVMLINSGSPSHSFDQEESTWERQLQRTVAIILAVVMLLFIGSFVGYFFRPIFPCFPGINERDIDETKDL